jgi:hypothetical protein
MFCYSVYTVLIAPYALRRCPGLKVHKHEIIWNFFLRLIKSLYALCKFSKKISLLFLWFSPEFRCSNISAVTEHTRNQIFLMSYPKNFFFTIFTLVLSDGFLEGFWKFRLLIVKICIWYFWPFFESYSMRMLSISGNDFMACWADAETISSHTEHTRNEFPRMLSHL